MTAILDASALLAVLQDEPGAATIELLLDDAVMSAVNAAEVAAKLAAKGTPFDEIEDVIWSSPVEIIDFTEAAAIETGRLWAAGRRHGLSLGDRACLGLARVLGGDVYTTDRIWEQLNFNVVVHVIR